MRCPSGNVTCAEPLPKREGITCSRLRATMDSSNHLFMQKRGTSIRFSEVAESGLLYCLVLCINTYMESINACIFCDKIINNVGSLASHQKRCKYNPNRVQFNRSLQAGAQKGCASWNKGKTTSPHVKNKISKAMTGKSHTNKTRKKLSKIAKERGFGGYVKGSGRGRKGKYNGIYCDSSWELAYLIYCFDNGIEICRCVETFEYEYNGKIKKYNPDFIVDGVYVEIKGYISKQWEAKLSQFKGDITVLYEDEMLPILDYVCNKYGKDFMRLYESL